MYLLTLSSRRALPLLPFLLYLSSIVLALPLDDTQTGLHPRGSCLSCMSERNDDSDVAEDNDTGTVDDCGEELPLNPILDGPTSDKSAGLGFEFETSQIRFQSEHCSVSDTYDAKGKVVNGRKGKNWKLTADRLDQGLLDAEYILDGTQIKIGSGTAETAAKAVANDIASWNPSADMSDTKVSIPDNACSPWTIVEPESGGGAAAMRWAPQITAPMPLQAIYDLFGQRTAASVLLPSRRNANQNMVTVTKEFFQSSPSGMSSDDVEDDLLGFFSLVMTYTKAADQVDEPGIKALMSIMPRTDFTTMFKLVKSKVKGDLYDIVKVLACYRGSGSSLELDTHYCSGSTERPEPNGQMDKQTISVVMEAKGTEDSTSVKDWMKSIQDGKSPDRLSEVDQAQNGQFGGLKGALENLVDSSQAAPLFEFRRLKAISTTDMSDFVTKAENAVIDFHKKYNGK